MTKSTTQIRHIATGTFHDVPKDIVALGGAETTLWIETKMQRDALQESLKIAAAEAERKRLAEQEVERLTAEAAERSAWRKKRRRAV